MLRDALYYTFVYPLESTLSLILSMLNSWIGSYGFSIITLSLIVNLFLLKLFFMADSASKNYSSIKSKLDVKIQEFKRVFKGGELYAYTKTLYRQNHYHPIFALKALGGLALQVPFFVAVVFLLEFHSPELKGMGFGVISDLSSPDGLLWGINFLPFLMTFFTLCNVWISSRERGARIQGGAIAFIFLILLYKMPSALLLYWTTSMAFALVKSFCIYCIGLNQKAKREISIKIPNHSSFFSRKWNACFTRYCDLDPKSYIFYRNISIFAILNLCILVFLYNPFALYASDITQFDSKETWNTLGALFGFFLLFTFLLIYLTSFFYKTRLLKIGAYGVCVVLMIALVYNFVLDFNVVKGEGYGKLNHMVFMTNRDVFNTPKNKLFLVDFFVLFFACITVFFVLKRIFTLLRLCSLSLILVTFFYFGQSFFDLKHKSNQIETFEYQELSVPKLLDFSKDKNILVLVLDAFTNSHFFDILMMYPKYFELFDGFVYYDNVLSPSNATHLTTPALIGGEKYSLVELYKKYGSLVSLDNVEYEAENAFRNTALHFENMGWRVDVLNSIPAYFLPDPIFTKEDNISWMKDRDISFYYGTPYYSYHFAKHQEKIGKILQQSSLGGLVLELINFGLFKISLYSIRANLYRDGWILSRGTNKELLHFVFSQSSDVLNMSELATLQAQKPTFKYIKSLITHHPFGLNIDSECLPDIGFVSKLPDKYKKFSFSGDRYHFDNEICAIWGVSKFLNWMKDNSIYDQSKIIIVSDHGYSDAYKQMEGNLGRELGNCSNPLLLVKDYNAKGRLKINSNLAMNYEIYDFIVEDKTNKGVRKQDFLHIIPKSGKELYPKSVFRIQDNVYDSKMWKNITKEFLDNLNQKEKKR